MDWLPLWKECKQLFNEIAGDFTVIQHVIHVQVIANDKELLKETYLVSFQNATV